MPVHDSAADQGARRSRFLRVRVTAELESARISGGLSYRELGRVSGIDRDRVRRELTGHSESLTIDDAARLAAVLGLELSASLHPIGDPVRDKAHLALLRRFRARLGPGLGRRAEVAMPITGDRRSADVVIAGLGFEILVEAETRLADIQALERAIAGKRRDLGIGRVILLVSDTRHNRAVVASVPELGRHFPLGTRAVLAALAKGRESGADGLVVL